MVKAVEQVVSELHNFYFILKNTIKMELRITSLNI